MAKSEQHNRLIDISEFEALDKLKDASFKNYHHRQTYEWKMCITIWTPLVAFIGIALTYPHVWIPNTFLYTACFFLATIHIVWQRNIKASNDKDTDKILECEQKLRKSLGLPETEAPKGFLVFKGWPHYIYVVITLGLMLLAVFINDLKRSQIVVLPNDLNAWLEKASELGNKKKDEFVAEILRTHIRLQDKEHQNTNAGSSPLTGKMLRKNTGENTKKEP